MAIDIPRKKHDFVDVAVFDTKTIDDVESKILVSMLEQNGANLYAILQDQVRPMLVRRSNMSSMQNLVDKLREFKMAADRLSEGNPSRDIIMQLFDNELSIEAMREASGKKSCLEAEDYYVFDVFLETMDVTDFKRHLKLSDREDQKVIAFGNVMKEYDSRRFSKSSVEKPAESYELALFKAFMTYLENEDLAGIIGIGDAFEWLTRIVKRSIISNLAMKILWCANDISRLQFTDFSIATVKGQD